jgi:hypothetical protein
MQLVSEYPNVCTLPGGAFQVVLLELKLLLQKITILRNMGVFLKLRIY